MVIKITLYNNFFKDTEFLSTHFKIPPKYTMYNFSKFNDSNSLYRFYNYFIKSLTFNIIN